MSNDDIPELFASKCVHKVFRFHVLKIFWREENVIWWTKYFHLNRIFEKLAQVIILKQFENLMILPECGNEKLETFDPAIQTTFYFDF